MDSLIEAVIKFGVRSGYSASVTLQAFLQNFSKYVDSEQRYSELNITDTSDINVQKIYKKLDLDNESYEITMNTLNCIRGQLMIKKLHEDINAKMNI